MGKIFTNVPPAELQKKIRNARESIRNKASREIQCPYCKRIVFSVFADSTGYIEVKCSKCKTEVLVDVVNMRRMNRA
ncbi:MAG: hypothetical protein R3Y53_09825 [Bacillota bacterium]